MLETELESREVADTLPNKLFQLLEIAIFDLKKAEKAEGYRVEMTRWHSLDEDGTCLVCLAGSVMAFTLNCPREDDELSFGASDALWNKMDVLNSIRCGCLVAACALMGKATSEFIMSANALKDVEAFEKALDDVPSYHDNKDTFFRYLNDVKELFERLYI